MIKDIITNTDFTRELLIVLISGALGGLIGFFANVIWNKGTGYINEKKRIFDYIWEPQTPVVNNYSGIKNISKRKRDWKMIVVGNGFDIVPNEMVEGQEAFKQGLIQLMNTEKDKYKIFSEDYGVSYILINAKNAEEYNSMAPIVAKDIINNNKEWITEIYSIKKKKDKNIITISLGVQGVHEILILDIQMFEIQDD